MRHRTRVINIILWVKYTARKIYYAIRVEALGTDE